MKFPNEWFFFCPQDFFLFGIRVFWCWCLFGFFFFYILPLCRGQSRDSGYEGMDLDGQMSCTGAAGQGRPGWEPAGEGDAESPETGALHWNDEAPPGSCSKAYLLGSVVGQQKRNGSSGPWRTEKAGKEKVLGAFTFFFLLAFSLFLSVWLLHDLVKHVVREVWKNLALTFLFGWVIRGREGCFSLSHNTSCLLTFLFKAGEGMKLGALSVCAWSWGSETGTCLLHLLYVTKETEASRFLFVRWDPESFQLLPV